MFLFHCELDIFGMFDRPRPEGMITFTQMTDNERSSSEMDIYDLLLIVKNSSKTRGGESNNLLWELSSFKDILLSYQSTTAMTEDISKDKTNFRESPSVLKSSVSGKMMFLMCSFQPNIMIYSIKEVGMLEATLSALQMDFDWLSVFKSVWNWSQRYRSALLLFTLLLWIHSRLLKRYIYSYWSSLLVWTALQTSPRALWTSDGHSCPPEDESDFSSSATMTLVFEWNVSDGSPWNVVR